MSLKKALLISLFMAPFLATAAPRPNILFAFADDWGRHAGAYGTTWLKTPTFDRIASEGILFTQAYTPVAKCSPCRASVLTGRFPWQNEQLGNHGVFWPPEKYKTYIETLIENGYYCARKGKGWSPGVLPANRKLCGEWYMSGSNVKAFGDFLDDVPAGKPFHFWFCSTDPHRGYKKQTHSAAHLAEIEVPSYLEDTPEYRQDVADYAYEVERFDRETGEMIQMLKERGLLENTLVIMSSDHGMPFQRAKGDTYMAGNHVPLAIQWTGNLASAGRTCDTFVSFVDIAPTLLELAGIDPAQTAMEPITGQSWSDIFRGEDLKGPIASRTSVQFGRERSSNHPTLKGKGYPTRSLRTGDFLYTNNLKPERTPPDRRSSDGPAHYKDADPDSVEWKRLYACRPSDELYNVVVDPECIHNLADNPEYRPQMEQMKAELDNRLRQQKDPRKFGGGDEFDQYPATAPWKVFHKERQAFERSQSKN